MRHPGLRTKLEELRQARNIHGGIMRLCVATLGGKLARVKLPSRRLRLLVFRTIYGRKYQALDEAELEKPMWAYPSINALFTRGVRPEFRPITRSMDQFSSPCDGTVQEVGRLESDRLLRVKGVEYSIDALLPNVDTRAFHGGQFAVFFLNP